VGAAASVETIVAVEATSVRRTVICCGNTLRRRNDATTQGNPHRPETKDHTAAAEREADFSPRAQSPQPGDEGAQIVVTSEVTAVTERETDFSPRVDPQPAPPAQSLHPGDQRAQIVVTSRVTTAAEWDAGFSPRVDPPPAPPVQSRPVRGERFRPGIVYIRRRERGLGHSRSYEDCASTTTTTRRPHKARRQPSLTPCHGPCLHLCCRRHGVDPPSPSSTEQRQLRAVRASASPLRTGQGGMPRPKLVKSL
jgi:hypothetical protein